MKSYLLIRDLVLNSADIQFFTLLVTIFSFSILFIYSSILRKVLRRAAVRQEIAEKKAYEADPIQEGQQHNVLGNLFNLYSKQIATYQLETQSRATWSFIFAILAMCAGMAFMFWGGQIVLADPNANHVAAGAAISAIGGGISAYITKTFLDVHKLSLTQLNRYFTQPVINDHIVMAQRLAEDVKDDEVRKKSYEKIVSSVTALIDSTNAELNKGSLK